MLFHCVRRSTAAVAQIVVDGDITTYILDPAHFTPAFAGALALVLAGVADHWVRHGDPKRPADPLSFRIERHPGLPTPVACVDEPGFYGWVFAAEHATEAGRAALDAAAREELRHWSQGA